MAKRSAFKKIQHKRYNRRQFTNPYFKKPKSIPWKIILPAVGLVVGVLGGLGFLLFSPRFYLSSVSVEGTELLSVEDIRGVVTEELQKKHLYVLDGRNRFLFDKEATARRIKALYAPESVEIVFDGDRVVVRVAEDQVGFVWLSEDMAYLTSPYGTVLFEIPPESLPAGPVAPAEAEEVPEGVDPAQSLPLEERIRAKAEGLPRIRDLRSERVHIGQSVLSPEESENILRFLEHLNRQKRTWRHVEIDKLEGAWAAVVTQEGYRIIFDPTTDADAQANHLQSVFAAKDNLSIAEYVDIRFGDHVYIR